MNGAKKFHKATGPAFNKGEIWIGSSGSKVVIDSVDCFDSIPVHTSDCVVEYKQSDGSTCRKDAWNFQVRYQHIADINL